MQQTNNKPLVITFIALLALLVATVAAAMVPLGFWNVWLALAIAATKTLLVVIVFMGLYRATGVMRMAAAVGLLWLSFALILVMADSMTRGWHETQAAELKSGQHLHTFDRVPPTPPTAPSNRSQTPVE